MKKLALFLVLALVAGCAVTTPISQRAVVFPLKGQAAVQVQQDKDACEKTASEATHRGTEAATGAGLGGLIGAGLGAVIGAIAGDVGTTAAIGAVVGAAAGGGGGFTDEQARYESIYKACMASRGYTVGG